jgi:hypothetical protein|tara:strand:- start:4343 stop:5242 length:900 start_codon:yes stop_codon:yes gene_type:complete
MKGITNNIVMVRPKSFGFNQETVLSNTFQNNEKIKNLSLVALNEFDEMVKALRSNLINVTVLDDLCNPIKPDAIFPNNWFSLHNGTLILYPMANFNRRIERTEEHIESIKMIGNVSKSIDYSIMEKQNEFLEGTGSLVLDRYSRVAYACLSSRTSETLLDKWCSDMDYKSCVFKAYQNENIIYHTNVMMSIGNGFAVVCMDSIKSANDKKRLIQSFEKSRHQIIDISIDQMNNFAGNVLVVENAKGDAKFIISERAFNSLNEFQLLEISKYAKPLPIPINVIEKVGGGGVRCMMAEVFS